MQRVSLFGYAKTTKALAKCFNRVTFYDDKCHKPFRDEDGYKIKPSSEFDARYSDLEITSPGISPSHPLIKSANNLISEYDYFQGTKPLKIWISGTNGKTTTTQMTEYILKPYGAISGGNIGTPLAELDTTKPIWLLETSSFTMHYNTIASPNIYALLPITPDHISWHGSIDEYEKAKLKPLLSMREGEIAIIPAKYRDFKTFASTIYYENSDDLARYFGFDISKIRYKGAFLLDAIIAMSFEKILYDKIDYDKINSFTLDPHRQEELFDFKNRLWVNDSKATNIDATLVAVDRYSDRFIHLILGGDDKGVDMEPLFKELQSYRLSIYSVGANSDKLSDLALKYGIKNIKCDTLANAIGSIDSVLSNDEIALLSPAAASLDQFKSYQERGDLFKSIIKSLT